MNLEIEKSVLGDGHQRGIIAKIALTLVVSLPMAGALNKSADASLADSHRLKSETCRKYVSASAVWSDRRQARSQSLKKWDHKVRLRYGDRFASWDTARQRRTRESYDLIDGNWYVTRIARPCEAQVLTKR